MANPALSGLARAHARFARATTVVYLGTAALAVVLVAVMLMTDRTHQEEEARQRLSLLTELRARALAQQVELLAGELTRLGLRSEVDLEDQNFDPERSLLRLTHEKSALFSEGVAFVDAKGIVGPAEPSTFLADGRSLAREPWFQALVRTRRTQVDAFSRDEPRPFLVIATPVLRGRELQGALLGVIDLARDAALTQPSRTDPDVSFLLLTGQDRILFPPSLPPWLSDSARFAGFLSATSEASPIEARLGDRNTVLSAFTVTGTPFHLFGLVDEAALFGPARSRFGVRLVLGLVLTLVPLLLFVRLLRASLRTFQKTEEDVLRDERLKSLGEAVNLIAHEVRNSLNGIRIGLDLVLRRSREPLNEKALGGLRTEIERLSTFTTELLSFSKGVVPRPVAMDLAAFVRKVSDLAQDTAGGRGVRLEIGADSDPVPVHADPALLHVVIANLVGNALEFAGGGDSGLPRVDVQVESTNDTARVRVTDNGPGVPDSVRPRLFEPFVTSRPNGVGIGLALSRRIARAHGGELSLDDDARPGAAFVLTLPRRAA